MSRRTKPARKGGQASLDRRGFLKAATLAGTGAVAPGVVSAEIAAAEASEKPSVQRHTVQIVSREIEQGAPHSDGTTQTNCGSDFMVDVMRGLGIEYVAAIPGNTFKGLHESVIN